MQTKVKIQARKLKIIAETNKVNVFFSLDAEKEILTSLLITFYLLILATQGN